jgi:hypothetical protein
MITLLLALACNSGTLEMNQGFGSVYTTRCSGRMSVQADVYTTDCAPPACHVDFEQVALSQVVVAVDPGEKVVGYAERTCVQTLQKLQQSEPEILETPETEDEGE